jgi:hypothetical protein
LSFGLKVLVSTFPTDAYLLFLLVRNLQLLLLLGEKIREHKEATEKRGGPSWQEDEEG